MSFDCLNSSTIGVQRFESYVIFDVTKVNIRNIA
jgi:hypothetical protein